jgi:hypothetical protein
MGARGEARAIGYVDEENVDERRTFAGGFAVNAGDLAIFPLADSVSNRCGQWQW